MSLVCKRWRRTWLIHCSRLACTVVMGQRERDGVLAMLSTFSSLTSLDLTAEYNVSGVMRLPTSTESGKGAAGHAHNRHTVFHTRTHIPESTHNILLWAHLIEVNQIS